MRGWAFLAALIVLLSAAVILLVQLARAPTWATSPTLLGVASALAALAGIKWRPRR